MSNKSMASCCRRSRGCLLLPFMLLLLLLLPAMPDAATRRARISATSNSNSNSISNNNDNNNETLIESKLAAGKLKTSATSSISSSNNADSKYEIRGVAGEPNYKSVNLTWEVEFVTSSAHDTDINRNSNVNPNPNLNVNGVTNDVEPPKDFQIFYCEMQNYGPQRCRVKVVNGTAAELPRDESDADTQVQHFAAAVDNLRMATRYSFHIRPVQPRRLRSSSARADFHDENEIESGGSTAGHLPGQSIVIPTKGFSAHATQCLAHASEIEVDTGPYFGGRIVVDGGDCGIKGNANDPADKYTMRIDHKLCGSMVKPETNTVETFITVQENLGIFTHSTRRFVVVCSYQSGIQTVRASFTVPGKNAGVAAPLESNDPFQPDEERLGRELRHMRYVNKSELVLKEPESDSVEEPAEVMETQPPEPKKGRALTLTSFNEAESEAKVGTDLEATLGTKYAKLVLDQRPELSYNGATWTSAQAKADANDDEFYAASLRYISANLGSVLVTVSISVIIIGICIVLLQRQRLRYNSNSRNSNSRISSSSGNKSHLGSLKCPSAHLPHKTLPRSLQQQQYQCTL